MITYDGYLIEWECINNLSFVSPKSIARQLGRLIRFGGSTEEPISVLTHSIAVAIECKLRYRTERLFTLGLVHDVAEAIVGDVFSPFKTPEQRAVEGRIFELLLVGWGINLPTEKEEKMISVVDKEMAGWEAYRFKLKNRALAHALSDESLKNPTCLESLNKANTICSFEYGFYFENNWAAFDKAIRKRKSKYILNLDLTRVK